MQLCVLRELLEAISFLIDPDSFCQTLKWDYFYLQGIMSVQITLNVGVATIIFDVYWKVNAYRSLSCAFLANCVPPCSTML
jgi:hypothetical protein